jgi:hypothetical protein
LAALRNRENQRRSRARRKDYIQELEQRLRQFEHAGVKATTEVQAAARKVAEENISLRSLLGIYGADSERIEDYLRTGDVSFIKREHSGQQSDEAPGNDTTRPGEACFPNQNCGAVCMSTSSGFDKDAYVQATRDVAEMTSGDIVLIDSNTPPRMDAMHKGETNSKALLPADPTGLDDRAGPNISTEQSLTPFITRPTSSDLTLQRQDPMQSSSVRDEISCLAAAEIIASMRGHDDPEEVWSELGCRSSRRCMVKNMAIFQIMDQ